MADDLEARLRAKAEEMRTHKRYEFNVRGFMGSGHLEKVNEEIALCDEAADFIAQNSKE